MNQKDRTEFDLIHNKIDHITQSIEDMKTEMDKAHQEVSTDIKFVKENLFNPHEGLWAETKQNTTFRESTSKWRSAVGIGVIGLFVERMWRMFIG